MLTVKEINDSAKLNIEVPLKTFHVFCAPSGPHARRFISKSQSFYQQKYDNNERKSGVIATVNHQISFESNSFAVSSRKPEHVETGASALETKHRPKLICQLLHRREIF